MKIKGLKTWRKKGLAILLTAAVLTSGLGFKSNASSRAGETTGFQNIFEGIGRYNFQAAGSNNMDVKLAPGGTDYYYNAVNTKNYPAMDETRAKRVRDLVRGETTSFQQIAIWQREFIRENSGNAQLDADKNTITNMTRSYLQIDNPTGVQVALLQYVKSVETTGEDLKNRDQVVLVSPSGTAYYLKPDASSPIDKHYEAGSAPAYKSTYLNKDMNATRIVYGDIDITDIVKKEGKGWYSLSLLDATLNVPAGNSSTMAGWSVTAVEEDLSNPIRYTKLAAGYSEAQAGKEILVTMDDNFKTTNTPTAKLIATFLDGDAGGSVKSPSDEAYIRSGGKQVTLGIPAKQIQNDGGTAQIPERPSYDFMCGIMDTIRTPQYQYNNSNEYCLFNMDIDSNYITGNGGFTFVSAPKSEWMLARSMGISVDIVLPEPVISKSVVDLNGGNLEIGDELEYTITVENKSEISPAFNINVEDLLENKVGYVSGSAKLDDVVMTDAKDGQDSYSYDNTSKTLAYSKDKLDIKEKINLSFKVKVLEGMDGQKISNVADLTYKNFEEGSSIGEKLNTPLSSEGAAETLIVEGPPVLVVEDKTISQGTDLNLEDLIKEVTDPNDGAIDPKNVVIDKGDFDPNKPGEYEITFTVTDSSGNKTTTTSKVKVTGVPTIITDSAVIDLGEEIDLNSLVASANDHEDGDLKDKVTIKDDGGFNKDIPGTYTITYEVTDADGNTTTTTSTVRVKGTPQLEVTDKIVIQQGDEIDLKDLVTSATDIDDGDLKDNVEIIKGGFDPNVPGTYEITYKVTDSDGNEVIKVGTVVVEGKPVLGTKDTTVYEDEPLSIEDLKKLVEEAKDLEDGDLTAKVEVTNTGGYKPGEENEPGTYEITYQVTDSAGNMIESTSTITVLPKEKPIIQTHDITVKEGTDLDLLDLIDSATDREDGDLKEKVTVKDLGGYNKDVPGTYEITYEVTDADGNTVTETATVTVKAKEKPVLTTSNKVIEKGTELDLHSLIVSAQDEEDGDLKDKVTILNDGGFNKDKPGDYIIVYEVVDSDGNRVISTSVVTVKETIIKNENPIIVANDKTIEAGMELNLLDLVASATDKEDGDLKNKVTVKDNGGFNKDVPGEYTVVYEVTDSNGNTTTKAVTVTVKEKKETNSGPILDGNDTWYETGSNPSQEQLLKDLGIVARDQDGNPLEVTIDTSKVDFNKSGKYPVTITTTDKNGNTTTKTLYITIKDKDLSKKPLITTRRGAKPTTLIAPKTGDTMQIFVYVILGLSGVGGFMISLGRRRVKK